MSYPFNWDPLLPTTVTPGEFEKGEVVELDGQKSLLAKQPPVGCILNPFK